MEYKEAFQSPGRTLELINIQANAPENLNFAKKYFPRFTKPEDIWEAIKPKVKFKADPQTVDTIQGISTLFSTSKNIHGVSGYGDCDCFVSSLASIAIANKLPFVYIIQGNIKPSHIAIKISGMILDLTNPIPDYLRQYNFTKYIKPMFVALADNDEEMAMELNDFGKPNLRRIVNQAKRLAPPVIVRTVDNNLNRINKIAARAGIMQSNGAILPEIGMAQLLPGSSKARRAVAMAKAGRGGLRKYIQSGGKLPASARAGLMLRKRAFKRAGFGDSEAALLSIENFSDDFGRGRISLKRGLQNVGKAGKFVAKTAMKAAPILLPVAGAALNFVAPGVGGKVAQVAAKGLQRIGGAKTLTAGRGLIKALRPSGGIMPMAPVQSFSPAVLPGMPSAGIETMPAPMQIMNEPTFPAGTYVTPAVPITAPKINPALLIGAGAIALFLLTRKK